MTRFIVLICFLLISHSNIFSQTGLDYSSILPYLDSQSTASQSDKEKIQTMFIQSMFVNHMMKQDDDLFKDDDEDNFFSTETNNFYNSILSYEISKILAKQDILGFEKMDFDY